MNNGIFKNWLSHGLQLTVLIFLSIVIGFSSGVSSTISSYMVSSFATSAGHASMCSYAYMAGLAIGFTLAEPLRGFLSPKKILICCCLSMILLNFVIITSESVELDILATFVIGGIRMIALLVVVLNMMPIVMPNASQRYILYGIYYPISLIVPSLSGMLMVLMTDKMGWHFSFHVCNMTLFIAIICVLLCIRETPPNRRILPFKFDWIGIFLASGWIMNFAYFCSYGRYKDWLDSQDIRYSLMATIVLSALLIFRTSKLKYKLFNLEFFKYRNVYWGLIFVFLFCILYSTTSLLTPWLAVAFHNNPVENAKINFFPVYGYLIGIVVALIYFKWFSNLKAMFLFSLGCYIVSSVMLYFLISTEVSEEQLLLPMVLRGVGISLSYVTFGLYSAVDIPLNKFFRIPVMFIFVRSYFGPTFFGGLYSWLVYHSQVDMFNRLVSHIDQLDSSFQLRFGTAMVNTQAYSTFSTQALLSSVKVNYGWSCLGGVILFIFIVVFPLHKKLDRKIFNWSKSGNQEEVAEIVAV